MEVQVFNPVDINRYAYASNNPARLSDPSGLLSIEQMLVYPLEALAGLTAFQRAVVISLALAYVTVLLVSAPPVLDRIGPSPFPDHVLDDIEELLTAEEQEYLAQRLAELWPKPEPETTPEPLGIDIIPPLPDPTPSPGETVTIYRAVGGRLRTDSSYWRIPDLRNPEFDPHPDPRGLSTFEYEYLNIPASNLRNPYLFPFMVSVPQGERSPLEAYPINVPGCTAAYTPPPTGHWSVACGTGSREVTRGTLSVFARNPANRGSSVLNPYYTGTPQERRFEWQIP